MRQALIKGRNLTHDMLSLRGRQGKTAFQQDLESILVLKLKFYPDLSDISIIDIFVS